MDEHQAPQSPILTRSLLAGRYEIRSLVGQGGIADVYSAFDRVLGRTVAVKILRQDMPGDRRVVDRFRREARSAASLGHPNIVALHDVGDDGDVPFMVMELISGQTLSEVIWREGPLSPERTAEVGALVADALAFAHQRGIVHRDVKPANIMLSPSGQVKVLDFGIAGALAGTSTTLARTSRAGSDEVLGTAEYLSPEQAQGRALDGRSDIYSLGVVLYEMLTGRPPFEAGSPDAVALMHVEREPQSPRQVRPEIPSSLESIVMRCLAKDPKARYQRAAQLSADLRRFQSWDRGVTAPLSLRRTTDELDPAFLPGGVSRWRGESPGLRRTLALAVILALVAGVAVLAVPFFVGGDRAAPSPPPRPVLTAPIGLVAKTSCDGFLKAKVQLTWFPGRDSPADGYAIYRSESRTGPFKKIELLSGHSSTAFVDPRLNTGATYFYVARSTAGSRMSPNSVIAEADTPGFCLF